jgi:hypothetical protein
MQLFQDVNIKYFKGAFAICPENSGLAVSTNYYGVFKKNLSSIAGIFNAMTFIL